MLNPAFASALLLLTLSVANVGICDEGKPPSLHNPQKIALERINIYLNANTDSPHAMFIRGVILSEQGKTAEAIQLFSEMTQRFPSMAEPYNNLGALYFAQGDYDKARTALESCIRLSPGYLIARKNLAAVYERLAAHLSAQALQLEVNNRFKDEPSGAGINSQQDNLSADIQAAVDQWADAWSSRDLQRYFSSYADSFQPPGKMTREQWQERQTNLINRPAAIHLQLTDINVESIAHNQATVSFLQSYREGMIATRTQKQLLLKKANERWLIAREISKY